VIIKKFYKYLVKNLGRSYAKLMTTLQVSYENVKFAASDVLEAVIGRIL